MGLMSFLLRLATALFLSSSSFSFRVFWYGFRYLLATMDVWMDGWVLTRLYFLLTFFFFFFFSLQGGVLEMELARRINTPIAEFFLSWYLLSFFK